MIRKFVALVPEGSVRNMAATAMGLGGLLTGQKMVGLSLIGRGMIGMEQEWRDVHPEFDDTLRMRIDMAVDAWRCAHQHPINRALHYAGTPMVLGGGLGLVVLGPYRPLWLGAAGWFAAGWALMALGHAAFEGGRMAEGNDVVAFVIGPLHGIAALAARSQHFDQDLDPDGDTITFHMGEPAQA